MDIPFCMLLTFQAFLYFVSYLERNICYMCEVFQIDALIKFGLQEMYTDNKTRERCGRMTDLTTRFQIKQ